MRADFYLIAKPRFLTEPLRLVCELARKANDANLWTLVLARDQAQAEELDELLWAFDDDAYIPHQIAGADVDEEEAQVLIVPPGVEAPSRALVINLRDDAYLGACERVLEVVPADPAAREPLRERWKQYKALGFEVSKYDM
ncbi:DNA polymerase III subunit chi [Xanthomonas translucens pv. graminis]|jgi:DNA polymerase-3 subunit chi|nr:DNA polymerase III holoenzyme chi subunit [Xanthomonas translucens pv. graminis ART-Xtg29]CTP91578.1 DNA polymerase III subunit chi [Xanthomonas translucens pv. arrhenatheri LMG 727]SBV39547.1 DNA polymerase III subunit chi [Xanthomonas translucens pv. graminis]SBV39728.1 DNA polymerase III subunit chi [Xanthomonas translucens pv. graminis]SBV45985.1 DNA polymerase III subunit chi [Xanthomonas translucens pv. graminis ART-Xtg29]